MHLCITIVIILKLCFLVSIAIVQWLTLLSYPPGPFCPGCYICVGHSQPSSHCVQCYDTRSQESYQQTQQCSLKQWIVSSGNNPGKPLAGKAGKRSCVGFAKPKAGTVWIQVPFNLSPLPPLGPRSGKRNWFMALLWPSSSNNPDKHSLPTSPSPSSFTSVSEVPAAGMLLFDPLGNCWKLGIPS